MATFDVEVKLARTGGYVHTVTVTGVQTGEEAINTFKERLYIEMVDPDVYTFTATERIECVNM